MFFGVRFHLPNRCYRERSGSKSGANSKVYLRLARNVRECRGDNGGLLLAGRSAAPLRRASFHYRRLDVLNHRVGVRTRCIFLTPHIFLSRHYMNHPQRILVHSMRTVAAFP